MHLIVNMESFNARQFLLTLLLVFSLSFLPLSSSYCSTAFGIIDEFGHLHITENTNTTIAKSYDDYYYYQEDDSVSPFFECKALKTISLPDSLISIDNYAFFRSGLTAVHIPAGVTDIGDYAFAECTRP